MEITKQTPGPSYLNPTTSNLATDNRSSPVEPTLCGLKNSNREWTRIHANALNTTAATIEKTPTEHTEITKQTPEPSYLNPTTSNLATDNRSLPVEPVLCGLKNSNREWTRIHAKAPNTKAAKIEKTPTKHTDNTKQIKPNRLPASAFSFANSFLIPTSCRGLPALAGPPRRRTP